MHGVGHNRLHFGLEENRILFVSRAEVENADAQVNMKKRLSTSRLAEENN
jgi:hypothetical protein